MANTQINITENGTTTLATVGHFCDKNIDVIVNVPTGSDDCNGLHLPESALVLSGDCDYRFHKTNWQWFLDTYIDHITTKDLSSCSYMFSQNHSSLKDIPFDFNFSNMQVTANNMFYILGQLEKISGKFYNFNPRTVSMMFYGCNKLKELPEFVNIKWDDFHNYAYGQANNMFNGCYSLREVPTELIKEIYSRATSNSSVFTNSAFYNCHTLNKVIGIPVPPTDLVMSSNMFNSTFYYCHMLSEIIFDTQEDGTPYTVQWKSQNIDLRTVGWTHSSSNVLNYNSGITRATEVTNAETYEAYKNDPDWWSIYKQFCKYNHDSAVRTIQSLPDASAYLATAGGTNTITFLTGGGSSTDEGAQDTLTEEEIAIAAAKGWTVAFGTY